MRVSLSLGHDGFLTKRLSGKTFRLLLHFSIKIVHFSPLILV